MGRVCQLTQRGLLPAWVPRQPQANTRIEDHGLLQRMLTQAMQAPGLIESHFTPYPVS